MNKVPGIVKGIALLLAIVAIGAAIGWLSTDGKPSTRQASNEPAAVPAHGTQEPPQISGPGSSIPPAPTPLPQPAATTPNSGSTPQVASPSTAANVLTNWEEKVDDILSSDAQEEQKARQMAAILPTLPAEAQVEVAQHLSNLVTDEDYGMISGFMTNSALSEEVLDVFVADSLNRPNAVKLPLLLEVARDPSNPKAAEAKEILELFLDEDYGNDWVKWQSKLQEWLINNPD